MLAHPLLRDGEHARDGLGVEQAERFTTRSVTSEVDQTGEVIVATVTGITGTIWRWRLELAVAVRRRHRAQHPTA